MENKIIINNNITDNKNIDTNNLSSNHNNGVLFDIVKDLFKKKLINEDKFLLILRKVDKVSEYLKNMQEAERACKLNYNKLFEKNQKYYIDIAGLQENQKEQLEIINSYTEDLRKAQLELGDYESTRLINKQYEIDQKKENIEDLKQRLQDIEDEQFKKLQTEIENYNKRKQEKEDLIKSEENFIVEKEKEIITYKILIQKNEAINKEKKEKINEANEYLERKRNNIINDEAQINQNKEVYEQLDNLRKKYKAENENKEIELKDSQEYNNRKKQEISDFKIKNEQQINNLLIIEENNKNLKRLKVIKEKEYKNSIDSRNKAKENKERIIKEIKLEKEYRDTLRKQADTLKKKATEKENEKIKLKLELEEAEANLKQVKSNCEKMQKDIKLLEEQIEDVNEDINFKQRKEKNKDQLITIEKSSQKEFNNQSKYLDASKKRLLEKVEQLKSNIEEMKNIRQTMSRAVAAREEKTRTINDEIQIKELMFLDMTKRHEELKTKYQNYHLKYETVLNERNKNVLKIQNANQRKSETREKMKIIVTEMDILQAELTETNNQLSEKKKDLEKIKQKQDTLKKEINEYQFEFKRYEEKIKKLTNENEKLHSILNSIESDMVIKRSEYETGCESRNLSGIQLIDRNDELCVFYEKIQHIESEINSLYKSILEKEQTIQRLRVDNTEVERFIEVNRKKIPLIPDLSNGIKELDNELKNLNKTLEELVKYIESPDNEELKRELGGEDYENDYLKMKYQQLCEKLNEKKEVLLEKELINEEINEIAEKLRNKALEDRASNLEISEKINACEIQFNEITRKNIALASELSMFNAILYNLESTKSEKETLYEKALSNYNNGEAPTDDCQKKLEVMIKLENHKKEAYNKRKEEIDEKLNRPYIMPNRKAPPKRFNEYEDSSTGLKKSYGKYAPFAVYPSPPNMRHYKSLGKLKKLSNSISEFNLNYK